MEAQGPPPPQGPLQQSVEDEGYTSPVEDDDCIFNYNPDPQPKSARKGLLPSVEGFEGYCRIPLGLGLLNKDPQGSTKDHKGKSKKEVVVEVDWEEIANRPYSPGCPSTWDDLQVPIPFRFHPDHVKLARTGLTRPKCPPFLLDSQELGNRVVDSLWRIQIQPSLEKNDQLQLQPKLQESLQKPIYIPLKTYIQHVFHLLAGRNTLTFPFNQKEMQFEKNPSVLIYGLSPNSLWKYSQQFVLCGGIIKRFNRYAAIHYDNKLLKEEGLEQSAVMISFLRFIANYVKLYQTVLMLNVNSVDTLTGLLKFVTPFRHQLVTLDWIFKSSDSGNAVDLLSKLNYLLFCQETPHIADLIRSLFVTCASAYLKYVSDWIFRGQLGPKSEFHIEKLRDFPYRDRRFWTKQFSHSSQVPVFLEKSVQLIFETGKAINLLNQIQSENVFSNLPLFCNESDVVLTPSFDFEEVATLYQVWSEKLRDFLTQQSYLIADISESISSLLALEDIGMDLETIEQAKVDRKVKLLASKQNELERQRIKKKELFNQLQEQLEESKAKKQKALEASQQEDISNKKYLEMRDKRDFEEEKRMRLKHFGDENVRIMDNTLFNRIHHSSGEPSNPSTSHVTGDHLDGINAVEENPKDLELPEIQEFGCGDQATITPYIHPTSRDSQPVDYDEAVNLSLEENTEETEDEEKFNPDKVKTQDPPQYSTSVSVDLSQSVSFLELVQSIENPSKENKSNPDAHCLNQFLSESITIPLGAQNQMVNAAILHYFICDKKLFFHVEALNSFLCLQNGLFGHRLTEMLVQEVNSKSIRTTQDISNKIGRLNLILSEAISLSVPNEDENQFVENLSFTMNKGFAKDHEEQQQSTEKGKSSGVTSDYEILDSIRLNYTVQWPLNIILTGDLLHNYERLFVFLMQLFRAELLLQQTYIGLKSNRVKSHQLFTLHHYRSRLQHFVRTVRNYVNVTVIQCTWNELTSSFSKLDSLEKIYEHLVRHIKMINTNCLLGSKAEGVMKLLSNQLVIIEAFCSQLHSLGSSVNWQNGEEIPQKDFKKLSQKFKAVEEIGKVFTDVAYKLVNKGFYPKVSYFLELYNFNGFFQIKK